MKKILFVDDDKHLLNSVKRGLHVHSSAWLMYFATSADEALELLATEEVEVLVSDFRMPEMSGIELLSIVETLYPHTIRVLLTGHPEKIQYSQTSNICHYFFTKPFKLHGFKRFLDCAAVVLDLLNNKRLIEHLNAINSLPIHPESFRRLQSCFELYDTRPELLVQIAGKDISLALLLFKLSSSANFSFDHGIRTVAEAVDFIDMQNFRSLLNAGQIFFPNIPDRCAAFELDLIQQHSFQTVQIAEALAEITSSNDKLHDVRLGALLHDCGLIVLQHVLPEVCTQISNRWRNKQLDGLAAAETQIIGVNHAEVGAYLAALWGVPNQVVEAIHDHVDSQPPVFEEKPVSHIVWHANLLATGKKEQSCAYYSKLCQKRNWQTFFKRLEINR